MPPLDNSRLSRSSRDRNERYGSSSAAGAAGPLRAIDPDAIYTANDWIAGIAGGSVGVMGTLIQLELKQVGTHTIITDCAISTFFLVILFQGSWDSKCVM